MSASHRLQVSPVTPSARFVLLAMFAGKTQGSKRTSENEAIEQLRKQRRQATQLQSQYKGMLKEINDLLKEDFTQIPCVLNALRSGTYKASVIAASTAVAGSSGGDIFNHNVVHWRDLPVNFVLKTLLTLGWKEGVLILCSNLGKSVTTNLLLISYGLEGSWKIPSKVVSKVSGVLSERHDKVGKRGATLVKKGTQDRVESVMDETSFWFLFGVFSFTPMPAVPGQLTKDHEFTKVVHSSGTEVAACMGLRRGGGE